MVLLLNTLFWMQFILHVDYRLCTTLIIHEQLWGYKVEDKLHLGVKVKKKKSKAIPVTGRGGL
jgi:hypothetical protein